MTEKSIRVRVPGTSANCGPGFDTLGVACTLYNELELILREDAGVTMEITGEGAGSVPRDETNIVWRSVKYLLEYAGLLQKYPGAVLRMHNEIPLSRGLGSSAAAIVAGLKAANVLIGNIYSRRELLQIATTIEGHPDNVAPAIFGGFTISTARQGRTECFSFLPKLRLKLIVAIPDFYLPTKVARGALPTDVPLKDAVFNIGHAAMMVAALCRGNEHFLRQSFDDALHQKYRAPLVPGLYDIFIRAKKSGALGAALSGAGPCVVAFSLAFDHCEDDIGRSMVEAFRKHDINARYIALDIDTRGAHIVNS